MGVGNLGWAEVAVVVVMALVVLGPDKLPSAARQIGSVVRQFRKISTGFQQELQNALDEPIEAEARRRGRLAATPLPQEGASADAATPLPQEGASDSPREGPGESLPGASADNPEPRGS